VNLPWSSSHGKPDPDEIDGRDILPRADSASVPVPRVWVAALVGARARETCRVLSIGPVTASADAPNISTGRKALSTE
jgi:hypothetical protein